MTAPLSVTPDQAALVRASYAEIARLPEDYAARFYHRLQERHPFTRALFPDDMTHQISVFRQTVDSLVADLDDLAGARAGLSQLAIRHVGYGVRPHHYAYVGAVLIDTFAEMAGPRFDAATRAAWEALYGAIAQVMIAAVTRRD
jgi:hemoglobin-like flavoprotein